jgi:hypothetical protein
VSTVPASIARAVDDRDGERCVRCGVSLKLVSGSRHHRQRRAVGGHTPSNLILLCGSGTTGCHGWVHSHPDDSRADGYIVPANGRARPRLIPILSRGLWFELDDLGSKHVLDAQVALGILADYGLSARLENHANSLDKA